MGLAESDTSVYKQRIVFLGRNSHTLGMGKPVVFTDNEAFEAVSGLNRPETFFKQFSDG